MSRPRLVSVIVVNYNGGQRLVENLRAIADAAAAVASEVLLVDNASTDGSADQVRGLLPGVRVVDAGCNQGYAAGVNVGLREASGDVFVILNSDVIPNEDALERLTRAITAPGAPGLVGGLVLDSDGRVCSNCFRTAPTPTDIIREALFVPPRTVGRPRGGQGVRATEVISGSVMALTRDTLRTLGPMDEEYFLYNEDVEWCRRAARKGMCVGVALDAVFRHEGGLSTRANEGPAFAARVLSDFQYFCEVDGVDPATIRRAWRVRLVLRSWLYRADALAGVLGRRPGSRRRAAVYRLLARAISGFAWAPTGDGQNAHPDRLFAFPRPGAEDGAGRPHVLQLIPNMEYGGAQRLVEKLVLGPLAERFRFDVLCLTHAGSIGEKLRAAGVPVHVAGMSGWRRPADWQRASDYCALLEPDLVHSHLIPADIAAHLGFGRRVPRISTKHNIGALFGAHVRLLERIVLRGVTVLAVGDAVARAKAYLGPWGVLPAVLESPPSVPVAKEQAPFFVEGGPVRLSAVGRLHAQKRLDIFLEAAAVLERRAPGRFFFRIVGEGAEEAALRRLAASLGLGDRVEFHPPVADVAAVLDDSDIVVMVSDCEGLPLTVLEMLARGRIPLVRRVPGTDEALPSALERCYVDSASPAAVADKVIEICDDPETFIRLAREGLEWVAGRSDYAAVTRGIYDELLGRLPVRVRVLHLITRLIVGGAQENTIASVARVDPDRFDSRLWIGPQTGSEGSLLEDARRRGLLVRVLPNLVREIAPLRDLRAGLQLIALLRRERFDIVHTHSSKAGILGRFAAHVARVPHVVHTVHGWGFHDHMSHHLKRFYVVLERMLEPWTSRLVSVSNTTTMVGLEEGIGEESSYALIRSGIPLERFHPDAERGRRVRAELGIGADELVVGSVGRLSEQKNPRDFVRMAAALSSGRSGLRFLYVGDGPLRKEVERQAADLGLGDAVLMPGIRGDVPDVLRAMDVFVLTSLWEGLPRVVLQALATGLPVVAYDTAGIQEAVTEGVNGHLVAPGDVERMAGRLGPLVDDASLRAEMGERASSGFDRSFSEDAMIRDLETLYGSLDS